MNNFINYKALQKNFKKNVSNAALLKSFKNLVEGILLFLAQEWGKRGPEKLTKGKNLQSFVLPPGPRVTILESRRDWGLSTQRNWGHRTSLKKGQKKKETHKDRFKKYRIKMEI